MLLSIAVRISTWSVRQFGATSLGYDWGKRLVRKDAKGLNYVRGFSAVAVYFDQAKGFTDAQRNLRVWIEANITRNGDGTRLDRKAVWVKKSHPTAQEPRLYGHDFCPLLPAGRVFHGALQRHRTSSNAEHGRRLYGTSQSATRTGGARKEGLLAVMGYPYPSGGAKRNRARYARLALQDIKAVVVDALGGIAVARQPGVDGDWLTLEEASRLHIDELAKKLYWHFFLPTDWREKRLTDIESHHAKRHARGEAPYAVQVTKDRAVYEQSRKRTHVALPRDPSPDKVGTERQRLGSRLYAARRERGMTQSNVGKVFGVGQKTISNWERGLDADPETGKARGKRIPPQMAPLIERWVETAQAPTDDEVADLKNPRAGSHQEASTAKNSTAATTV